MIKIAEKDKQHVYIYSEHASDIYCLTEKMQFICTTTYNGYPALLVKKETTTLS